MLTRRRPCAAPSAPAEPDMFGPVKQPRLARSEPQSLHNDVLALRRDGACVLRAGRHAHVIDGVKVSDEQLFQLAADARRRLAAAESARAAVAPPKPEPVAVKVEAAPAKPCLTTQEEWDALEIPSWAMPRADSVPFWRRGDAVQEAVG